MQKNSLKANFTRRVMACTMVILLIPLIVAAQVEFRETAIDGSGYPDLSLEFECVDASGMPIVPVGPSQIAVEEDGVVVHGSLLQPVTSEPTALVIAVDVSGSMKKIMPSLQAALQDYARSLGSEFQLGLISFHDEVETQVGLGTPHDELIRAIEELKPEGKRTELFFGVNEALKQFSKANVPARRYLLLLSDGRDEGGAYDVASNLEAAEALNVQIIGYGLQPDQNKAWRYIERLALESGGSFLLQNKGLSVADGLATLGSALNSKWVYHWESRLPSDGGQHAIRLAFSDPAHGDTEADFQIATPLIVPPPPDTTRVDTTMSGADPSIIEPVDDTERSLPMVWWYLIGGIFLVLIVVAAIVLGLRAGRKHEADEILAIRREGYDYEDVGTTPDEFHPGISTPPITHFDNTGGRVGATLTWERDDEEPLEYSLREGVTLIGRDTSCDVHLEHEGVSRKHARISNDRGVFFLEDLGSSNGTLLDGKPLPGPIALGSKHEISISGCILTFIRRSDD